MCLKLLAIYRAQRFSPNSVENDRLILYTVVQMLRNQGNQVTEVTEEELIALPQHAFRSNSYDCILTMIRSHEGLSRIPFSSHHREGSGVGLLLNSPVGISICSNRVRQDEIMRQHGIPVPPAEGNHGVWMKRGEGTAEVPEDTIFCNSAEEINEATTKFLNRGITSILHQAHIPGDLVKFYGVAGTEFFHYLYPTDIGRSKFGSELHNGEAHHYHFDQQALKQETDRFATAIGVPIYGGDAIVTENGSFYIIDFNDWPTFSPCRQKAAEAIVTLVYQLS